MLIPRLPAPGLLSYCGRLSETFVSVALRASDEADVSMCVLVFEYADVLRRALVGRRKTLMESYESR